MGTLIHSTSFYYIKFMYFRQCIKYKYTGTNIISNFINIPSPCKITINNNPKRNDTFYFNNLFILCITLFFL